MINNINSASANISDDGEGGVTDRSNVAPVGVPQGLATIDTTVANQPGTQLQSLGPPGDTDSSVIDSLRQSIADQQCVVSAACQDAISSARAALQSQYDAALNLAAAAKSSGMAAIQASAQTAIDKAAVVKARAMSAVVARMEELASTVAAAVVDAQNVVAANTDSSKLPEIIGPSTTSQTNGGFTPCDNNLNVNDSVQCVVDQCNLHLGSTVNVGDYTPPSSHPLPTADEVASSPTGSQTALAGTLPPNSLSLGNPSDSAHNFGCTAYKYTASQMPMNLINNPPQITGTGPDNWNIIGPAGETVGYMTYLYSLAQSSDQRPCQLQYGFYPPCETAVPFGGSTVVPPPPPPPPLCPPCNPTDSTGNPIGDSGDACNFDCSKDGVVSFCQCVSQTTKFLDIDAVLGVQSDGTPLTFTQTWNGEGLSSLVKNAFTSIISYVSDVVDGSIEGIEKQAGCTGGNLGGTVKDAAIYGLLDRWLGIVPDTVKAKLQYAINCNCQYILPGVNDLNSLFRSEYITEDQWKASLHMQGVCDQWQCDLIDLGNTRVGPAQTDMARRRELIDHDTYCTLLRRLGVKDEIQRTIIEDANCQRPGLQDIVQMMVRDVTDQDVVDQYQLDEDFDQKYGDKLKKFAKDQGVDDELAKLYWRQHWQMPGDGQLFDMLHRLRPGRSPRNDGYDDIELTNGDIKSALQINDVMPYWVDKLMAISDRQLERRILVRIYCQGLLTDDEMISRLQDYGYNQQDATLQQQYYKQDNLNKGCSGSIGLTKNQILKYYKNGDIPRDDAVSLLGELSIQEDDAKKQLDAQDYIANIEARDKERVALQKRYMLGDLTKDETLNELTIIGVDQQRANDFVNHWETMLRYKRKEGSASLLCTWYGRGLLSIQDFNRRLSNMGWSQDDVLRIIQTCLLGVADKAKAAADKHAKEVQTGIDKAAAKLEAQRKRAAAARCSPAAKCLEDQLVALGGEKLA